MAQRESRPGFPHCGEDSRFLGQGRRVYRVLLQRLSGPVDLAEQMHFCLPNCLHATMPNSVTIREASCA